MIPTPKRKILTKTTINTAGEGTSTPAAAAATTTTTTNAASAATTGAAATSSQTEAPKASKAVSGELPAPTDEYAL